MLWVKASLPGSGRTFPLTQIPELPKVSFKKQKHKIIKSNCSYSTVVMYMYSTCNKHKIENYFKNVKVKLTRPNQDDHCDPQNYTMSAFLMRGNTILM